MKLNKKIVIGVLIAVVILFISAYLLSITGKLAAISETEKSNLSGEIISVNTEPNKPKIFERFITSIVVKNNGIEKNYYSLELKITRNGQLKNEDDFAFSLLPDNTVEFSPTYTMDDFNEHEIVLRLYDEKKTKLYDEKILTFVVQSDTGPFDLELDTPARMIGPDDPLPATIKINNVGIYGTDVNLSLNLYCANGEKISKNMYVFVNGSSDVEKQVLMETCGNVGQNILAASLTLYGKELASSKIQFYISSNMPEVSMITQDLIKVESGKPSNFAIELKNPSNFDLKNIKPFVYGIPSDWLVIVPPSLNMVKANDSAVFIVTINIPENVESKSYEITIGIGGDNAFSRKNTILSVTGLSSKISIPISLLYSYWVQIVLVAFIILLVFLFITWKKGRKEQDNWKVLKEKWESMTKEGKKKS